MKHAYFTPSSICRSVIRCIILTFHEQEQIHHRYSSYSLFFYHHSTSVPSLLLTNLKIDLHLPHEPNPVSVQQILSQYRNHRQIYIEASKSSKRVGCHILFPNSFFFMQHHNSLDLFPLRYTWKCHSKFCC